MVTNAIDSTLVSKVISLVKESISPSMTIENNTPVLRYEVEDLSFWLNAEDKPRVIINIFDTLMLIDTDLKVVSMSEHFSSTEDSSLLIGLAQDYLIWLARSLTRLQQM